MKFGQTYLDRLREESIYKEDMSKWKKWYAWYPVYIKDGRRVWLEHVERRYVKPCFDWKPEYRLIVKNFVGKRFCDKE